MLNHKTVFTNQFHEGFVEDSIPASLLQFICNIEHGVDIKSHLNNGVFKSDIAIAQLLQYNCKPKGRGRTAGHRHSKDYETPFAVYMGLLVYAKTRKRQLIDLLNENGICISYNRVLEVSALLGESVVNQYVTDGVVCPPILRKGLFTTSAMDNIDHNPTATTASTSFLGTSISMFQHPTLDSEGEIRPNLQLSDVTEAGKVPEIPESYTNIEPAFFNKKNPEPHLAANFKMLDHIVFRRNLVPEYDWLEKVNLTQAVDASVDITWSAHHASQRRSQGFKVSITSLLPLLRDQAHSVATVKHVLNKVSETVAFLNPGQTPVITADQPLYALAKQIQWHWPEKYGEDKLVIMFGGLHIEMTALKSIGTLLKDGGWTSALVEAGVASPGTADSFLSASNITRTRQAHQITVCCLHQLMKDAYNAYKEETPVNTQLSFDMWRTEQTSPQFMYWFLVYTMEMTILVLIRSFREANFELYREALFELIPYFFANNNVRYARWLPIHLQDMMRIDEQHPEVAREFHKGNFVVHKSDRAFSSIAIDQAHEQNNAVIKGDGGAVGLTENSSALRRWMVAGPEVSRLIERYEAVSGSKEVKKNNRHHEQTEAAQKGFIEKVKQLKSVIQEMGNPFMEESDDLFALDTKDIADDKSAELIKVHHQRGKKQFESFMADLHSGQCSFYQPFKKNVTTFFKREQAIRANTSKTKILKDDYQLFARMFISCQNRQCDLNEFFMHENQPAPASLSDQGKLRPCTKSDLSDIVQAKVALPEKKPETDVLIVDGSAMVNELPPRSPKTFDEYVRTDILSRIEKYSLVYKRTDIVFDVYWQSSLKSEARSRRGKAIRRRVVGKGKTPSNWQSILRDAKNKQELFHLIADEVEGIKTANKVIVTKADHAVSNHTTNLDGVDPCSHEEADTRIFLHAQDAVNEGHKSVMINANDTDIVIIAISVMSSLMQLGLQKMWVSFGKGEKTKWIPIHEVVPAIGPKKTRGILFFHAFSGCDMVSAFHGKSKKSAWKTWEVCDEVSKIFSKLSKHPSAVEDNDLKALEKFVVPMYDRSSEVTTVNEARLDLFARKQRQYDQIPPTQVALKEHAKRAAYVAGYVWGQALKQKPGMTSPSDWGWVKEDEGWKIFWTPLPPVAKSCWELTKCGCTKACTGKCKCFRYGLTCTGLCSCSC